MSYLDQLTRLSDSLRDQSASDSVDDVHQTLARRSEALEKLRATAVDPVRLKQAKKSGEAARQTLAIRRENLRQDLDELRAVRRRREQLRKSPKRTGELIDLSG